MSIGLATPFASSAPPTDNSSSNNAGANAQSSYSDYQQSDNSNDNNEAFSATAVEDNSVEGALRFTYNIPLSTTDASKNKFVDVIAIPLGDLGSYASIDDAQKTQRQVLTATIPELEDKINSQLNPKEQPIKLGKVATTAINWWMNNPVAQWLRSPAFKKQTDFNDPNRTARLNLHSTDMRNFHLVLAIVRGGGHVFIQYTIIGASMGTAITVGTMSAFFGVMYEQLGKFLLYKGYVPKGWISALGSLNERLTFLSQKVRLTATETLEKDRLRKLQNESLVIQQEIVNGSVNTTQIGSVLKWMHREFAFHSPQKGQTDIKKGDVILESLAGGLYKYWLIEILIFLLPAMAAEQGWSVFITEPVSALTTLLIAGVMSVWMQFFADIWNYNWSLKVKDKIDNTLAPAGVNRTLFKEALVDGHRFMSVVRGLVISLFAVSFAVFLANNHTSESAIDLQTIAVLGVGGVVAGAGALKVKHGKLTNAFSSTIQKLRSLLGKSKSTTELSSVKKLNFVEDVTELELNNLFVGSGLEKYLATEGLTNYLVSVGFSEVGGGCGSKFSIF